MALTPQELVRKTLDDLRVHISKITNRPIDPDVDNMTCLIETLSMCQPEPLSWRGLDLTQSERRILDILASQRGRVFSRDALANGIYFDRVGDQPGVKIIDVKVCHIRAKLVSANYDSWIENAWGSGYRLIYKNAREGWAEMKTKQPAHNNRRYPNALVG